jgi:drug/metabolite transporter (DMT)-like permease
MERLMKTPMMTARSGAEVAQDSGLPWEWTAFGAIVLASCGHLLIKLGLVAALRGPAWPGMLQKIVHYVLQPEVAAGLAIYAAGTALWISAVSRKNISFLYPLTALNYVLVSLGGWILLGENISPGRWLGISIVVAGVALLQLSIMGEQS